jgi:hypothetical protein
MPVEPRAFARFALLAEILPGLVSKIFQDPEGNACGAMQYDRSAE